VIFKYLCLIVRYSSLICGKAGAFARIWSKFRCTEESCAYLRARSSTAYSPIPFGNQNRQDDIECLCQNVRHGLTYSWQSGSICRHIIELLAHRRSASQRVRNLRHGTGILGSNSPFQFRGFPGLWLKIIQNWDLQSCPGWASWICMKPTLTSCESLWMLSLQPRHTSRATNKPPMRMYLQYVVNFVYYRLLYSHHCFVRLWISGPSPHKIHQDNFTFRCRRLIPLHAC